MIKKLLFLLIFMNMPIYAQFTDVLCKGQNTISPGDVMFSENGDFVLIFHYEGNISLYKTSEKFSIQTPDHLKWTSNTNHQNPHALQINPDGNLVLYGKSEGILQVLWNSSTHCSDSDEVKAQIENNGNFTVRRNQKISWCTSPTLNCLARNYPESSFKIPTQDLFLAAKNAYPHEHKEFSTETGKWVFIEKRCFQGIECRLFLSKEFPIAILAFAGTNGYNLKTLYHDATLLFRAGFCEVSKLSRRCAESLIQTHSCQGRFIYVTGHSLGGVSAQLVASRLSLRGAAFNTVKIPSDMSHGNSEFYVHNTSCGLHSMLNGVFYGKYVQHTDTCHGTDAFERHFGECGGYLERCVTKTITSPIHEAGNCIFKTTAYAIAAIQRDAKQKTSKQQTSDLAAKFLKFKIRL